MGWTRGRLRPLAGLILLGAGVLALGAPPAASQQAPLSANDWLESGRPPKRDASAWRPGDPVPPDAARLRESQPPSPGREVAETASEVPVDVRRLNAADPDGAGIISARQAGLPDEFWTGTDLDTALRMIRARPALPASAQVARRVLEAQLAPPDSADAMARQGDFFAARVDQLIAVGALPSARDLLQGAGQDNTATYLRLFDLSLLLGGEDGTCR
ncbi:MAG: hypothetical protein Q4G26_12805, partial [Paracoccus sp. (in: a-proteobacteria)]|nr:hypothetical protein [Paracoccus sp. (in: a-proteobacteria)]